MTEKELKNLVYNKVKELLGKFNTAYKKDFGIPEIKFTKRGATAGCVSYRNDVAFFNFNMVLLKENVDHFIKQTVTHEVAHYCVWLLFGHEYSSNGRRIIHGKKWKNLMGFFGVNSYRCHNYNTDNCSKKRKVKRFTYKCGCSEYQLTSIRHNRVLKEQASYSCPKCGGRLEFVG